MSNLENFKRFVILVSSGVGDRGQTGGVGAFQVLGVASFGWIYQWMIFMGLCFVQLA